MGGSKDITLPIKEFADFVNASERRKISIIRDLKQDSSETIGKRRWYTETKKTLRKFLQDEDRKIDVFDSSIIKLNQLVPQTTDAIRKRNADIKGLRALKTIFSRGMMSIAKNIEIRDLPKDKSHFTFWGLKVNVKPDLLMYDLKTNKLIGFLKIIFTDSYELNPMKGEIITGLTREHLQIVLGDKLSLESCIVLHLFTRKKFFPPASISYHKMLLKKAVGEIVKAWDSIPDQ